MTRRKIRRHMVASLVGAVVSTNIVTADQSIAIVLPLACSSRRSKAGLAPVVLSRTIAAAGRDSALIPGTAAAIHAATLARPFSYMPSDLQLASRFGDRIRVHRNRMLSALKAREAAI